MYIYIYILSWETEGGLKRFFLTSKTNKGKHIT